jgi:6-phosphogluconolactonase (cycloisomerase 2 family)
MAISADGSSLFVASTAGITPFSINSSTGALTQGTVFDASGGLTIEALAVDPAGKWLLAASSVTTSAGTLTASPLSSGAYDKTSGRIQYSMPLTGSVQSNGIAISPSGYSGASIIAVAMGTGGTAVFPFTSANTTTNPIVDTWTPITPYGGVAASASVAVAIDPQNRLLYIGETNAYATSGNEGALRVYNINSTAVNEFTSYTKPYAPAGTGPHAILPSADGKYVYAASWDSDDVAGYSVTASALTALSGTVATGTEPSGLVEDSTSGFVLGISQGGSPAFDAYGLSSGTLTLSTSNSTVGSPVAIVAVPN